MKCADCGAENSDDNSYCGKCGFALSSPDKDVYWSKQYGSQDFGGRVVRRPDGVYAETDYSLFGWREHTEQPRWMVVLPIAPFLAALFVASLVLVSKGMEESEPRFIAFGLGTLGISVLVTLILYWIYYRPPKGARDGGKH